MNFLAHALLAGDVPALIVGGVTGDWIKGPLPGALPDDLAKGVALHRAIDSFAESHPAFRRSRSRVSVERRRYAGVLVDVFYDHLLARNWAAVHGQPLDEYCEAVYRMIKDRVNDLPISAHPALMLMAKEDWLTSYAKIEGIADVLVRMSRRTRQPNPLANGEQEFLADVDGFTGDFYEWIEGARAFCQDRAAHMERAPDVTNASSFETVIRSHYYAIKTGVPEGVSVTLIHIDADQTGVASGTGSEPSAVIALKIGWRRTALDHFRHDPPTPLEMENAIAEVEDVLSVVRSRLAECSTLFTMDETISQIAHIASGTERSAPMLSRDAMEVTFQRLAAITLGRPASLDALPSGGAFAATLLILREFMHHLNFSSIIVKH